MQKEGRDFYFSGVVSPLLRAFREYGTKKSDERLQKVLEVIKVFNEYHFLAVIITDSLAYSMSVPESDIDVQVIGKKLTGEVQKFQEMMEKKFPYVYIQIDEFYDLEVIQQDLILLAENTSINEQNFVQERGHDLSMVRNFYLTLSRGDAMVVGGDFQPLLAQINEISKSSLLLKYWTIDLLEESLHSLSSYFYRIREQDYLQRLQESERFVASSPATQAVILHRIQSEIRTYLGDRA